MSASNSVEVGTGIQIGLGYMFRQTPLGYYDLASIGKVSISITI